MAGGPVIYLDTHVVVWIYAFGSEKLSRRACQLIEQSDKVLISPIVLLEIELLGEIGKLNVGSKTIFEFLTARGLLEVSESEFGKVVHTALDQKWTRDPFDRLITAQAALNGATLITKDRTIRDNYSRAAW
jgi:PIN domain nuclease of toxin-antitoxin system